MIRKNIYLGKEQVTRLKKLSEKLGIPYSEIIRRAIDEILDKYEVEKVAQVL